MTVSVMNALQVAKRWLGCWLNERWRTECALCPVLSRITGIRWRDLHNRIERLECGGDSTSRVCGWKWTSELTVCQVFPEIAQRLYQRCFQEWPLVEGASGTAVLELEKPQISVILPVGNPERHAAMRVVLASFLGQTRRDIEVIVVEQSSVPRLGGTLPAGVRYLHIMNAEGAEEFNKSRLMNEAVRKAKAPWVLLHDSDIVVPSGYVDAVLARASYGWEAVRPIRFLFYLGRECSASFAPKGRLPSHVDRITQNFPGGSTAIKRETYMQIGGHDERFVGWGGEDTEFLDRLRTRRLFPGHFAPAIHLWHLPAPKKLSGDRNQDFLDQQLAVPVDERIRCLVS